MRSFRVNGGCGGPTEAAEPLAPLPQSPLARCLSCHLTLPLDEPYESIEGIEVLRDQLFVPDRNLEALFEKADELHDAGRVDDSQLQERIAARELVILLSVKKILND